MLYQLISIFDSYHGCLVHSSIPYHKTISLGTYLPSLCTWCKTVQWRSHHPLPWCQAVADWSDPVIYKVRLSQLYWGDPPIPSWTYRLIPPSVHIVSGGTVVHGTITQELSTTWFISLLLFHLLALLQNLPKLPCSPTSVSRINFWFLFLLQDSPYFKIFLYNISFQSYLTILPTIYQFKIWIRTASKGLLSMEFHQRIPWMLIL